LDTISRLRKDLNNVTRAARARHNPASQESGCIYAALI